MRKSHSLCVIALLLAHDGLSVFCLQHSLFPLLCIHVLNSVYLLKLTGVYCATLRQPQNTQERNA
jgi:hypothetical protein